MDLTFKCYGKTYQVEYYAWSSARWVLHACFFRKREALQETRRIFRDPGLARQSGSRLLVRLTKVERTFATYTPTRRKGAK